MIKISKDEYLEMREDYVGLCLKCGAERYSCEPDAREYECEECLEKAVYGIEELLLMDELEFEE
jgi:hypothetical protein